MNESEKNNGNENEVVYLDPEQEETHQDTQPSKLKKTCCCFGWVVLGTILIIFLFLVILTHPRFHPAYQSRAKGTLRSISSAQIAYRSTNEENEFGSFDALHDDFYIADGYNLENMIEGYTMTWNISNISTVSGEVIPAGVMNSFTIVAYPLDTRPGYLNTFGVTEDRVVRVYNPEESIDNRNQYYGPNNPMVKTWDPIL